MDLKDKWRNLLRVAELPPAQASARSDKKREGPSPHVLDRVRPPVLSDILLPAKSNIPGRARRSLPSRAFRLWEAT